MADILTFSSTKKHNNLIKIYKITPKFFYVNLKQTKVYSLTL